MDDVDSNIYDYDGEYESFKSLRTAEVSAAALNLTKQNKIESRYIQSLKATAKVRDREKERIFEKLLLKEREKEDAEFGDKPKFVTSAYKEKLKEMEKWDYEDNLTEQVEKLQDVKSKGMQGFYANLLTKNISMGNDVEANAISAYTSGSQRQQNLEDQVSKRLEERIETDQLVVPDQTKELGKELNSDITRTNVASQPLDIDKASNHVDPRPKANSLKEEQIASARERYLARKRTIHEVNESAK